MHPSFSRGFPGQVLLASYGCRLGHDPWHRHTPRSFYFLHLINGANLRSTVAFLCCKRFQEMLNPRGKLAFLQGWSMRIYLYYFENLKAQKEDVKVQRLPFNIWIPEAPAFRAVGHNLLKSLIGVSLHLTKHLPEIKEIDLFVILFPSLKFWILLVKVLRHQWYVYV